MEEASKFDAAQRRAQAHAGVGSRLFSPVLVEPGLIVPGICSNDSESWKMQYRFLEDAATNGERAEASVGLNIEPTAQTTVDQVQGYRLSLNIESSTVGLPNRLQFP